MNLEAFQSTNNPFVIVLYHRKKDNKIVRTVLRHGADMACLLADYEKAIKKIKTRKEECWITIEQIMLLVSNGRE